jgi:hypothetical protein
LGPTYVFSPEGYDFRHVVELGATIRVKELGKFQEWFKKIPGVGRLPFDFSQTVAYVGCGVCVNQPSRAVISVGFGGFRFGR